jgi:hypothetical protein
MIWRCILDSLPLGDQFNKHHAEEEDVRSVANFVNDSVVYHQISKDKRKWQHTFSLYHHMH